MSNKSYLSVYAKSFSWAGFFLPKKTFKKCSALYDFCRVADNIADSNELIDIKKNNFDEFKNNFDKKNLVSLKMILIKKTSMILLSKICGILLKSSKYL